jgi:hypothetical protein
MDRRRLGTAMVGALALAALVGCGSGSGSPGAVTTSTVTTSTVTGEGSGGPTTSLSSSAAPSGTSAVAIGTADGEVLPAAVEGAAPLVQQVPGTVLPPAGITGLLAWDTSGFPPDGTKHPGALTHDHVPGPVDYAVVPPVGGPHNAVWLNVGVYTAPVPSERAVHAMEHGAVWITYRPDLAPAVVFALAAFVQGQALIPEQGGPPGQANRYVLVSPWASADLPAPVVASAWGYQLRLERVDDPRLRAFVDTFRNSTKYTPEHGSPVDGVPVLTGGRAAVAGSAVPNPEGAGTP